MSVRHFSSLFRPKSIAVIGAAEHDDGIGGRVMHNLQHGGFAGPIMPVNPKLQAVAGTLAYRDVESLPMPPDLAVVCTPPDTLPAIIDQLGRRGTRAAVTLGGGTACGQAADQARLDQDVQAAANAHGIRVLGPNSLGFAVPAIGLNASFAAQTVRPGRVAFVSQSWSVCSAVLDWAPSRDIGFSHFVSLGRSIDIDFGDLLDYLGSDPSTRAILLYIESIRLHRDFMSAARAAARNKPVLAIKAGRVREGARIAASHTGTMAGTDAVYDAAFRRAGMLRVYDLDEMFTAVETLARARPVRGRKLSVLSNGGGIAVMAVDELINRGGSLAELTEGTREALRESSERATNPVELPGDASPALYAKAMNTLLAAKEVDTLLVMHAPSAATQPAEIADEVLKATKSHKTNVMTCWVGQSHTEQARNRLREAGLPSFETPAAAVRAFMHLVDYRRNQDLLMETPASLPTDFLPDTEIVRRMVRTTLAKGGETMTEPEALAALAAYGIPIVQPVTARDPREAGLAAARIDGPVALKILSPEISHKSEAGGVQLNLVGQTEVEAAAQAMLRETRQRVPDSRIVGFAVQPMLRRSGAEEIIIGVTTDPAFGPVILFGQGGTEVEIIHDYAVGLPPLNMSLARELIGRTRVFALLKGRGFRPPADLDAISLVLVKISQMVIDIPEIVELDINPLSCGPDGATALDARIRVVRRPAGPERLAIRPYPKELEEILDAGNGRRILMRPIRPEDEPNHHVFISRLTPEDIRFRFFGLVGELPHSEMARLTQIDYDREMAFIAIEIGSGDTLGVVRVVTGPDNESAEFAVTVRSDCKSVGLGQRLMAKMIAYCKGRGTTRMVGQVLTDNVRMLRFCERLGFKKARRVESDIVEMILELADVALPDGAASKDEGRR